MAGSTTQNATFLFTDIEGSTRMVQRLGRGYEDLLETHRSLIRTAIARHGAIESRDMGDGLFIVFADASAALAAAIEAQRALCVYDWPPDGHVAVRMGMHTGEVVMAAGDYIGLVVHQAARVSAAGHGGQVLLTEQTRAAAAFDGPLRDLGPHRLKDLVEPLHLFEVSDRSFPGPFPPIRSLEVRPNNLPVQNSSFIGRRDDVAEVVRLATSARVVTLVGPGGAGKTRLAIEAGADLLDRFFDGVRFVDLATSTDEADVREAVMRAVGPASDPHAESLQQVLDHLGRSSSLLILDNCEQVLDPAASVVEAVLAACPGTHIVATSRERLGVDGETVRDVPPLAIPDTTADPADLLASDAVRLFLDRAASRGLTYDVTNEQVRAIGRICARLDGIPLAIELAAARAPVLTPVQIDERLDQGFAILGRGKRGAQPRQQTLQAAIAWSDALLTDAERLLFYRLSVFGGSVSLDDVEQVCADDALPIQQIVDLLDQLVSKSLVRAVTDGREMRYRLLGVIRLYATHRLGADVARLADRLVFHLVDTVFASPIEQIDRLQRFDEQQDNVRAALAWCLRGGDPTAGARLAVAVSEAWTIRGHLGEGHSWLTALIERLDDPDPIVLRTIGTLAQRRGLVGESTAWHQRVIDASVRVGDRFSEMASLSALGDEAHARGAIDEANERYTRALQIARSLPEGKDAIGVLLGNLGHVRFASGDLAGALSLYEESLAVARRSNDIRSVAEALQSCGRTLVARLRFSEAAAAFAEAGQVARVLDDPYLMAVILTSEGNLALAQGDTSLATDKHEEALSLRERIDDRFGTAISRFHLGDTLLQRGELEKARGLLEQSLATFEGAGAVVPAGACLTLLGSIAARAEDYPRARMHSARAVDVLGKSGEPQALTISLESAADLLARCGAHDDAVVLLSAAARLRTTHDLAPSPFWSRQVEAALLATRTNLSAERFDAAWQRGASLSTEGSIAAARASLTTAV